MPKTPIEMPAAEQAIDAAIEAAAEQAYIVVHDLVGPWLKGEVLSLAHLAGIDIDRLLGLGAIAPHQE